MSLLSLIIPAHNGAPFLSTLFQSIRLNQMPGLEIIVINDGSTDGTPEVLEQVTRGVTDVTVIHTESPVGPSAARNIGMQSSSGKYITFADSDDWFAPGYLVKLTDAMDSMDVDFLRVDYIRSTDKKRELIRAPIGARGVAMKPKDLIGPARRTTMVDHCNAWSGIFQRRLLDQGLLQFPTDIHTAEDRLWNWKLHLNAESCAAVDLAGYFYRRQVSGSLTAINDERQMHYLLAFGEVMAMIDEESESIQMKAIRSFLAIMAHHLKFEGRFPPNLRRQHRRLVRAAIQKLHPELRSQCIKEMGGYRAGRLNRSLSLPVWCPL